MAAKTTLIYRDEAVPRGHCIMMSQARVVYSGPLLEVPELAGAMVLMNPADFDSMHRYMRLMKVLH